MMTNKLLNICKNCFKHISELSMNYADTYNAAKSKYLTKQTIYINKSTRKKTGSFINKKH